MEESAKTTVEVEDPGTKKRKTVTRRGTTKDPRHKIPVLSDLETQELGFHCFLVTDNGQDFNYRTREAPLEDGAKCVILDTYKDFTGRSTGKLETLTLQVCGFVFFLCVFFSLCVCTCCMPMYTYTYTHIHTHKGGGQDI